MTEVKTISEHYARQATPEVWSEVDDLRERISAALEILNDASAASIVRVFDARAVLAQGTEAQRAETSSGSVHDGPVAKPCAQTKGQSHVR